MLERPIDAKSCNLEAKRLGLPAHFDSPHMAACRFCLDLHLTAVAERAIAEEEAASGSSYSTYVATGEAYYQRDDLASAESALKEALAIKNDSFEAWKILGECYCADPERSNDAADALESAAAISAPTSAARQEVLFRLGELCTSKANFQRAREVFYDVCQTHPTASSWLGLGLAYVGLDELDNAEECLSEANILNNLNPLVWGHLTLLALQTGRESEATLSYKEALKLGLSDTELLRTIGQQQFALGKLTLAEGTLRRVASLEATDAAASTAQTQRLLGDVLMAQRSFADALGCYESALEAKPDDTDVKGLCVAALTAAGKEIPAKYL